jgi:hypothetical protein
MKHIVIPELVCLQHNISGVIFRLELHQEDRILENYYGYLGQCSCCISGRL